MLDPAIIAFFEDRKNDWRKKNIKESLAEDQKQALELECVQKFALENWIPDAAKRAGQINVSTHPCTFSHPSARKNKNGYVSSIVANATFKADGYLRTGNVKELAQDALGNAAALDVYKFLMLKMSDGNTLLQHLQDDSAISKFLLTQSNGDYDELRNGFLSIINSPHEVVTSSKIKQVYFPVGDNYHLLSILTNSSLVYELRARIDALRFSEKQKELRELKRQNKHTTEVLTEIYDVATIAYGGTKPQNISVLNNQFGGKARVLVSAPPKLEKRNLQFPRGDCFGSVIRHWYIREPLRKLHNIFTTHANSSIPLKNLRVARDNAISDILDYILQCSLGLRRVSNSQFKEESTQLPLYQKIWLCESYKERRIEEEWLDELCQEITRWIYAAYRKEIKNPITLGNAEWQHLLEYVSYNKENFR
ncbi:MULTISPECIES: type I-F CRISPR-associated protein Csy1 [Cysteiniphilum]|uniref:type I-F CRISPR-associated protein Csy1 n=1 Tax=Cysteiniphilum TaxID=2056696 RepID=UPI001786BF62|nr:MULTISPECIES: type I-F CRISPR-associated protein Csy1 [Cysteiniphilum]